MSRSARLRALVLLATGASVMALVLTLVSNPHALPAPSKKPWSQWSLKEKERYVRANLRHARGQLRYVKRRAVLYAPAVARRLRAEHRRLRDKAARNLAAILERKVAASLQWRLVGGTSFGPSIDPGMGTTGYCGSLAAHPWAYAELVNGGGLGGLPCFARLVVRNPVNGRTAVLERVDIGYGQGSTPMPGGGGVAVIDLWETAHYYLGFSGYGSLLVAPAPRGWSVGPR